MLLPNYIVKSLKFDCLDESGVDWLGSDEPLWVLAANAAGKAARDPLHGIRRRRLRGHRQVQDG